LSAATAAASGATLCAAGPIGERCLLCMKCCEREESD